LHECERQADGTTYVLWGDRVRAALRGDDVVLGVETFREGIAQCVRSARGWIFVSRRGAVASSETFTGTLHVLPSLPRGAVVVAQGPIAVVRHPDRTLSRSDGVSAFVRTVTPLPFAALEARFETLQHGHASLATGDSYETTDGGATWRFVGVADTSRAAPPSVSDETDDDDDATTPVANDDSNAPLQDLVTPPWDAVAQPLYDALVARSPAARTLRDASPVANAQALSLPTGATAGAMADAQRAVAWSSTLDALWVTRDRGMRWEPIVVSGVHTSHQAESPTARCNDAGCVVGDLVVGGFERAQLRTTLLDTVPEVPRETVTAWWRAARAVPLTFTCSLTEQRPAAPPAVATAAAPWERWLASPRRARRMRAWAAEVRDRVEPVTQGEVTGALAWVVNEEARVAFVPSASTEPARVITMPDTTHAAVCDDDERDDALRFVVPAQYAFRDGASGVRHVLGSAVIEAAGDVVCVRAGAFLTRDWFLRATHAHLSGAYARSTSVRPHEMLRCRRSDVRPGP
jgi:hypothetical protein